MKIRGLIFAGVLMISTMVQAQNIPAFPGAEGFGAYASGGRGGDVYTVTSLNNSGAGTLREALDTAPAAGRTIVFAVSGYIPVNSDTNFQVPANVTIAGQTAPGDGIGLKGGRMLIIGNNTIMRHFRIRHGKYGTGGDCLNIASGVDTTMLDHISMMFSTDENFSFFGGYPDDFTMQYSSTSWGMERHNAGGLWDLQDGSCHHSLWAHHRTRNPKARPAGLLEWINNVTFHWRNEAFIMGDSETPANWKANVQGCYYISIDDADDGSTLHSTALTKAHVSTDGVPNFSLYLDDTLIDYNENGLLDGIDRGYDLVDGSEFVAGDAVGANRYYKSATPFAGAPVSVTVDDPLTAYKKVVSSVGPLRLDAAFAGPLRDELDSLLIDTVTNQYSILVQKDGWVDGEDPERTANGEQLLADQYGISNNGFGTLNSTAALTDSDGDGMPDEWEMALGFNVAVQSHNTVFGNNGSIITESSFFPANTPAGYVYLDEYLHFCAIPHAWLAKNTAEQPSSLMVDLSRYTSGFTNAPAFVISNVVGGSVEQNGSEIVFTPTENYYGRAGFDFSVTDADGSSWEQQFAILVTVSASPRELVWIGGTNGNAWDTESDNWQNASGASTRFSVGDRVVFDDRGSAGVVTVSSNMIAQSMTVSGASSYGFSGAGVVNVVDVFTNASSGTLTLSTVIGAGNGTLLDGGVTVLNAGGNISGGGIELRDQAMLTDNTGSGSLALSSDILVVLGETGNLNLSPKVDVSGAIAGSGTLNLGVNSTGDYFTSDCSGFSGQINVTARNGADELRINLGYSSGLQLASGKLHLGDGVTMHQTVNGPADSTTGTPHYIGELSGSSGAEIGAQPIGGRYCTWTVGALNTDSTFAGIVRDSDYLDAWGGRGKANLSKVGSGTLTLSGNNTYSGNTSIYGGELRVTGSLGDTDVYIGSGAKLSGSGAVGRLLSMLTGGEIEVGNAVGTVGAMTTSGGITLEAGALYFDLSSNPSSGNDRIINSAGTLTFDGTDGSAHFVFNLIDGALSEGTYTLISGGSATAAPNSPSFSHNLVDTETQVYSLQRSAGGSAETYVRLVVTDLDPEPPAAPTGMTVTPGNTQVTIRWDAMPGASSYMVKRATSSDGTYATVGTTSSTEFVDTGLSNLTSYYYVVVAVNSYGESAASGSLVAVPELGSLQINSGGSAVSPYSADAYYSSGGTWSTDTAVSTSGVTDPAPAAAYQTERNGDFSYTVPGLEPGKNYLVRLHFAEIYHTAAGSRVFDVSINGSLVLDNFDIYAQTGARYQALVREFTVPADSSGELEIGFVTVTDNAKVSAIEIQSAPQAPEIEMQPSDQSAVAGGSVTFSIMASGDPAPTYQWMKDGVALDGETTASLTLSNVQAADQGLYSVLLENSLGVVISESAALAVGTASDVATGVFAVPGNSQVALYWYAASEASSYTVQRSLVSGGPYETLSSVPGISYTDLAVQNGTTYYYMVTTAGGASEEVSAAPQVTLGGETIQVEAASADVGGGVTLDSNNAGYHVSSFANFPTTGGYVQFNNVDGGTGGSATLTFRYALGNTARTGSLSINGTTTSITFPGTGAWTTWSTVNVSATLTAGASNTIRVESTGSDLGNVDEMTVLPTLDYSNLAGADLDGDGLVDAWERAMFGGLQYSGMDDPDQDGVDIAMELVYGLGPLVVDPVRVDAEVQDGQLSVFWPDYTVGWLLQYCTNLNPTESEADWYSIPATEGETSFEAPVSSIPFDPVYFRLIGPQ